MKIKLSESEIVKAEPVSMDKDSDGEVYYMMKVEGEDFLRLVFEKDVIFEKGDTIV